MTRDEIVDLLDSNEIAFEVVEHADGVLTVRIETEDGDE